MSRVAETIILRIILAGMTLIPAPTIFAQGLALNGVGPINRSMAGAATAAPIDAAGALHWNPGSINGLRYSEVLLGLELLFPQSTVFSSAFGASGATKSDSGAGAIPTFAWVHKFEDSHWSVGLGMFGIAGFRVNYPASLTNPILTPQSNSPATPGGLGRIYAEAEFFQIAPTIAYAFSEKLSVGVAPTITAATIALDPFFFAAPNDADGSGAARYGSGRGTRLHWGGGLQAGVYFITEMRLRLGFSIKSPQWMESFRFHSEDELGRPQRLKQHIDYPMILSLGASYTGLEDLLLALDVRYFDWKNTRGFGGSGFDSQGAVAGLGWSNVFAASAAASYHIFQPLYIRLGYSFNQNPIRGEDTFFNIASPLIVQHTVSVGMSWYLTKKMIFSASYLHGFANTVSGGWQAPGIGAVSSTLVTSKTKANAGTLGVTVRY